VQHKQQRDNFAVAKTGLGPSRFFSTTDQMRLPLHFEGLAKIIYFTENLYEPI
jgi:hypothetical protein